MWWHHSHQDILYNLNHVCPHTAPRCPGLTVSLQPWSALSVSDKWSLIILNSAHLRWCVCQMTERRVRVLSDVSVIDSFSFHRSLDSYLWCSRDQRKTCFQQHIRSHAFFPLREKMLMRTLMKQEEEAKKKKKKRQPLPHIKSNETFII